MKKIIITENAPAPIGPYSQAVEFNGLVFLSGQIAIDPKSGDLVLDNLEQEMKQVMSNIEQVLSAANLGYEHIIKTSIFLKRMSDFNQINEIYSRYFEGEFPARETVEVSMLPKDVNVEISIIAGRF